MRIQLCAVLALVVSIGLGVAQSGPPLPQVHRAGLGCGGGAAPPALDASLPILGEELRFELSGAAASTVGLLCLGGVAGAPLSLGGGCSLQVDLGVPPVLVPLATDSSGSWSVVLHLPALASLAGRTIAAQAALPGAAPPGLELSNGLALVLGQRRGPLAGRAGPPGPHIAQIQALGSDSWLDLGAPQPDPLYGLATGRSYTPRMAWSEALRGAFLTGEGLHGYVNPATNRYVDDVWFYDLAHHAWVCVKPGSDVGAISLHLNQHRFEVDFQDRLVPVAQLGHGYEFITFDERRQKFFMLACPNTYWIPSMGARRLQWLGDPNLPLTQIASPWLFNTVSGLWERLPPGANPPSFQHVSRCMVAQHIPSENKVWVWGLAPWNRRVVWYFDTQSYTWSQVTSANDGPAAIGNGVSCFDSGRRRVYYYGVDANRKARLWHYEISARRWVDDGASGIPAAPVIYATAFAAMTYDSARQRILCKSGDTASYPTYRVYDIQSSSWSPTPITPPAALRPLFRYKSINACYAPPYDVHILHISASGNQSGRILVYRL